MKIIDELKAYLEKFKSNTNEKQKKLISYAAIAALVLLLSMCSYTGDNSTPTSTTTATPTVKATVKPTETVKPTQSPTPIPTVESTPEPTPIPTIEPTPVPTVEPTPEPTVVPVEEEETTEDYLYIGKTGTKYHEESCRTLKNGGRKITLSQAKKQGRAACKVCNP